MVLAKLLMNIKNVSHAYVKTAEGFTHVGGVSGFGLWAVGGWFVVCFFLSNLPAEEEDLSDMSEIKLKHQDAHGKFREQRLTHTE